MADRRYASIVNARLDEVEERGFATVRPRELPRWFGKERYVRSLWSDLQAEWEERGHDVPLLVGCHGHDWLLLWGDENKIRPVEDYANGDA